MNFDLTGLLEVVNRKAGKTVDFLLAKDSKILVKSGDNAFSFDNEKLEDILKQNDFNHFHQPDTLARINEELSKHIIEQLTIKN